MKRPLKTKNHDAIIISALSALTSVLTFSVQVQILKNYGANCEADAFYMGAGIPSALGSLLSGILSYILIPQFYWERDSSHGLQAALGGNLVGFTAIGIAITTVVIIFSEPILGTNECSKLAQKVSSVYAFAVPLTTIIAILCAAKQVDGDLKINAILQPWPSLIQLIGISTFGKSATLYTVSILYLMGCLSQILYLFKKTKLSTKITFGSFLKCIKKVPITASSLAIFVSIPITDIYWAKTLGEGSLTYLANCQRIIVGLTGILSAGVSTLILNKLSSMQNDSCKSRRQLTGEYITEYNFAAIPLILIITLVANEIVAIVFERGQFTTTNSAEMAKLLKIIIWGMLPMGASTILFKAMYAESKTPQATIVSLVGMLSYFLLSGKLTATMGILGIGYAYNIVWCGILLAALLILNPIESIGQALSRPHWLTPFITILPAIGIWNFISPRIAMANPLGRADKALTVGYTSVVILATFAGTWLLRNKIALAFDSKPEQK